MQLEELIKKHHRYPDGKFWEYDFYFNEWVGKSFIQEQHDTPRSDGAFIDPDDLPALEAKFQEYEDDGSPLADKWGTPDPYQARNTIQEARAQVERFEFQTKRKKQQAINRGERFKKEEPTDKQLHAQAWYDVKLIERNWLQDRITELQKESEDDDAAERKRLMQSVSLGSVEKINYETGRGHISYMKVEPLHGDGPICIIDKASPYNGMSVLDFREFVIPLYKLARKKLYEEKLDAWKVHGAKPNLKPSERNVKPAWPRWPQGIVNHLLNGKASQRPSEHKMFRRTKR